MLQILLRAFAAAAAGAASAGLLKLLEFLQGPAPEGVDKLVFAVVAALGVAAVNYLLKRFGPKPA